MWPTNEPDPHADEWLPREHEMDEELWQREEEERQRREWEDAELLRQVEIAEYREER